MSEENKALVRRSWELETPEDLDEFYPPFPPHRQATRARRDHHPPHRGWQDSRRVEPIRQSEHPAAARARPRTVEQADTQVAAYRVGAYTPRPFLFPYSPNLLER